MEWLNPQFAWTAIFVPLVVGLFLLAAWQRRRLAVRFGSKAAIARLSATLSPRRRRWRAALRSLAVALMILALVGPRFGTRIKEVTREGIDLVIALDVSASMLAEDVAPNRLERARNEIKNLLGDMDGDRIALVTFAGDAFIQCPLTTDYGALRLFLDVADPSLIPTPGTDFGAALEMALQAFKAPTGTPDGEGRTRAVLFVSDGENHIADLESILDSAREEGVVIFSAGVGETEGAPIPEYRNGRRVDYKKDRTGAVVTTRLEEAVLQDLARDGSYFRVARTSSSLPRITAALDQLDQTTFGQEEFEEYEERYQWPLALAFLLLIVEWMIPERRRKPDPDSSTVPV
ncbi:MAG: VWA domain-containing protein [Bacteroidetes bacterium]|nr:VWA domain-containing protein [Bacteroidota bacterium]MDA0875405.1 VWA domain-containing protein [Bacteroidota bacterium]